MKGKMQGVTLVADWDPKPGFKVGAKDIEFGEIRVLKYASMTFQHLARMKF